MKVADNGIIGIVWQIPYFVYGTYMKQRWWWWWCTNVLNFPLYSVSRGGFMKYLD